MNKYFLRIIQLGKISIILLSIPSTIAQHILDHAEKELLKQQKQVKK